MRPMKKKKRQLWDKNVATMCAVLAPFFYLSPDNKDAPWWYITLCILVIYFACLCITVASREARLSRQAQRVFNNRSES